MRYTSTRNNNIDITGTQAIIKGMSSEGGLFVPKEIPKIKIEDFLELNYLEIAAKLLKIYFPEIPKSTLEKIVANYKEKFENPNEITPIKSFGEMSFLELYHGPTSSFKDMALTLLPGIMRGAYDVNDRKENILILTATSGDTGSAAIEGFKSQDRIDIAVFYPDGGVSQIQKLQMESIEDENVFVNSIIGNFDDAQRSVKEIFLDSDIEEICKKNNYNLASANSINIARLISQIAYYIYAYVTLLKGEVIEKGEKIDIVVPTGNFGDILAGIYGKFMGVPIENAICASNANDVLTRFFDTGVYNKNREFLKTLSPSMDILVSSNLERFLYEILDKNSEEVNSIYEDLNEKGEFTFPREIPEFIKGISVDDNRTKEIIGEVFEKFNYLIDPHTAVAYEGAKLAKNHPLIVSTASPYKFPDSVLEGLGIENKGDVVEKIPILSKSSNTKIPKSIESLISKKIENKQPLKVEEIKETVKEIVERKNES